MTDLTDYVTENERDANVALWGSATAVRNCETEESRMVSAADKNDRYSFLKRIQMWQRLRHCDAGMDMARCGTAGRWIGRSRPGAKIVRGRFLNLGRAGRE